ncbi:hypothetical protein CLV24_104111 [Pontibacter ummariensis]|uniref:Uncharacterized protein n=1 Tax=Pontibacter ummariensis TaxID=1610492 RepID=A0A239D986_9BACT|nr:hypothetical protein CLV24_104111 [Pontibacter ummariensis]SNS28608.1 hypothetical protein SAMN06296052_104110 [Pontibacter ummariensis]
MSAIKPLALVSYVLLSIGAKAQEAVPSPETQVKAAVLAAPSDKR